MQLSIESLQKMGAFTGAPVEREITWAQGGQEHTATVYVRQLSYHSTVSELASIKNGDAVAARIASCICDEAGKPVFTPGDLIGVDAEGQPIMVLDPDTGEQVPRGPVCGDLVMALLGIIGQVNALGKTPPPSSPTMKSSGVSSSLPESEAEPSPKPSSSSVTANGSSGNDTETSAEA